MEKDIHDRLDRARALARDKVERAASGFRESAQNVGTRAKSVASQTRKQADKMGGKISNTADHANRLVTEHPLAAVAAAVAVGALAAHFLPRASRNARLKAAGIIGSAARSGRKVRDVTTSALPLDEAEKAIEQLAEATRKANNAATDLAGAGYEGARTLAANAGVTKASVGVHAGRVIDGTSSATSRIFAKARRIQNKQSGD